MFVRTNLVAVGGVLIALAVSTAASPQAAYFTSPFYASEEMTTAAGASDDHRSVPQSRHRRGPRAVKPYGQW
jgi:hypothetical protein